MQRIGRVGDAEALVRPVLEAAQPFGSRNKMAFTFARESIAPAPAGARLLLGQGTSCEACHAVIKCRCMRMLRACPEWAAQRPKAALGYPFIISCI